MLCWPFMSYTPRARGIRKPLHFCQAESFCFCSTFKNPFCSCRRSWAAPGWQCQALSQLCHRHRPALSASGRNPPGAACHRTGFFPLQKCCNYLCQHCRQVKRWCQVPASWNGAQNAAPTVPTALGLFHPIPKDTGLPPLKKENYSSGKVHSLRSVRICSSTQGHMGSGSHRHTQIPACISYFLHC